MVNDLLMSSASEGRGYILMAGTLEGAEVVWFRRAKRASQDAFDWSDSAPGLAYIRQRDAEWLMERYKRALSERAANDSEAPPPGR